MAGTVIQKPPLTFPILVVCEEPESRRQWHYVEIVATPICPKCQSDQLDEDWGSHGEECPPGDHQHLICTNPQCLWVFTVSKGSGKTK